MSKYDEIEFLNSEYYFVTSDRTKSDKIVECEGRTMYLHGCKKDVAIYHLKAVLASIHLYDSTVKNAYQKAYSEIIDPVSDIGFILSISDFSTWKEILDN